MIKDRGPVFTRELREMLGQASARSARLARRSPNLNAHVERFIGSIREECLNRVIPCGAMWAECDIGARVADWLTARDG